MLPELRPEATDLIARVKILSNKNAFHQKIFFMNK
jgi:hypothetical protein